jgi:hypothetical protein
VVSEGETFKKLHCPKKKILTADLLWKTTSTALITLEHLVNSRGMTMVFMKSTWNPCPLWKQRSHDLTTLIWGRQFMRKSCAGSYDKEVNSDIWLLSSFEMRPVLGRKGKLRC